MLAMAVTPVLAADEKLSATEAYEAQVQACDVSSGPLLGQDWTTCEQYMYEFAQVAGLGAVDKEVSGLIKEILNLLSQVTNLTQ